jgi:hypothetical protein
MNLSLPTYDWQEPAKYTKGDIVCKLFSNCSQTLVRSVYDKTKCDILKKYGRDVASHKNISDHVVKVLDLLGYPFMPLITNITIYEAVAVAYI